MQDCRNTTEIDYKQLLYLKDFQISELQSARKELELKLEDRAQFIEELQREIASIPLKVRTEMQSTIEQLGKLANDNKSLELNFQTQLNKSELIQLDLRKQLDQSLDNVTFLQKQLSDQSTFMESIKADLDARERELLRVRTQLVSMSSQNTKLKVQIQDKVRELEQEIAKNKVVEQKHLHLRDEENRKLKEHYKEQMARQREQYDQIIQANSNELNHWRYNYETQIKQNILLMDETKKKEMLFKDWGQQRQTFEERIRKLERENSEVLYSNEHLQAQLRNAGKDINQKNSVLEKLKDKIIQIQVQNQHSKGSVSVDEKLRIERTNLVIEHQNQMESLQSESTFEKIKMTEHYNSLKRSMDEQQKQCQRRIEEYEHKMSQLYTHNVELLKQCEDNQMLITSIRHDCAKQVAHLKEAQAESIEALQKEQASNLLRHKIITWIKEFVRERRHQQQLARLEEKWRNERERLSRFIDQRKQVTVEDVFHVLDSMSPQQLEIIKNRFRQEIWDSLKENYRERDQQQSTKLATLQSQNQTLQIQLAKQKHISQELQASIDVHLEEIAHLNKENMSLRHAYDIRIQHMEILRFSNLNTIIREDSLTGLRDQFDAINKEKDQRISELQVTEQYLTERVFSLEETRKELTERIKVEQQEILERFTRKKEETFKEVNAIFMQMQEYVEQLLEQIRILKSKSSTFEWRGNDKITKDIDKFFSFYFSRPLNMSTEHTARTQTHKSTSPTSDGPRFELGDAKDLIKHFLNGNLNQTITETDTQPKLSRLNELKKIKRFNLKGDQGYDFSKGVFAPGRKLSTPHRNLSSRQSRMNTMS